MSSPQYQYDRSLLSNGLRVVSHTRKESESIALGFWIGAGGRYESKTHSGISHFMEHLIFKGTQKRTSRQIKASIEGVGGSINAFTDEEFTCVWAKVQPKDLDLAVDVLSDMVLSPELSTKEIDRERQVVIEEIRMYRDQPMHFVHDVLNTMLWPNHALGRDVAGTPETLQQMDRKALVGFKDRFYAPKNMVVTACGRVQHEALMQSVQKHWGRKTSGKKPKALSPRMQQTSARLNVVQKQTEQTHWSLGFHAFPKRPGQVHALSLLNIILGGNMSSRLFHNVRETRGLAYDIGSQIKRFKDAGYLSISAGVEHGHLEKCLKVVFQELKRLANKPVSKQELAQAKEYLCGQVLFGLEDTVEHMSWMGECEMLLDKVQPIDKILERACQVTAEEIQQVAQRVFKKKHINCAVIGPLTDAGIARVKKQFEEIE